MNSTKGKQQLKVLSLIFSKGSFILVFEFIYHLLIHFLCFSLKLYKDKNGEIVSLDQ